MDKLTTSQSRVAFARICVKITADEAPPSSIKYIDENGKECLQEVQYEWILSRCMLCKIFGHSCEAKAQSKHYGQDAAKTQHHIYGQTRSRQQHQLDKRKSKPYQARDNGQITGPSQKHHQIKTTVEDEEFNLTKE